MPARLPPNHNNADVLMPKERKHSCKEGLCYHCRKPGHYGPNCPARGITSHAVFTINGEDFQEGSKEEEEVVDNETTEEEQSENCQATQELPGEV